MNLSICMDFPSTLLTDTIDARPEVSSRARGSETECARVSCRCQFAAAAAVNACESLVFFRLAEVSETLADP